MPYFDLKPEALADYRSSVVSPPDFDAFWSETLEEARSLPLSARFEPVDHGLKAVDVFDVSFAGFGGHPIRAWYIRPRGVEVTRGVVKFIGYGGGRDLPHQHLLWPSTGRAVLVMDTRGQGGAWSAGDTPDPVGADPSFPGFMTRGILDRNAYYYRRLFTDAVRAVETMRSRGDVDPDKVAVAGGSQGGGITLAVAGLDAGIFAAMMDVPFLCDFPRAIGLTDQPPYQEIVRWLRVHRVSHEAAYRTLNYFDGVNFAARAKAAALFSVALMDETCPPSTVYGAFNAYAGRSKDIEVYPFNMHEGGGSAHELRQVAWLEQQG